jgi:hypothetical protein
MFGLDECLELFGVLAQGRLAHQVLQLRKNILHGVHIRRVRWPAQKREAPGFAKMFKLPHRVLRSVCRVTIGLQQPLALPKVLRCLEEELSLHNLDIRLGIEPACEKCVGQKKWRHTEPPPCEAVGFMRRCVNGKFLGSYDHRQKKNVQSRAGCVASRL